VNDERHSTVTVLQSVTRALVQQLNSKFKAKIIRQTTHIWVAQLEVERNATVRTAVLFGSCEN